MKRIAALLFTFAIALSPVHAAENQEAHEKDMTPWLWANFLILAGGAGYLASKKGGPYFASRSAEIRKSIAESEKLKAEAEVRAAAVNTKLANLETEIATIRTTVREEQAHASERIQRDTVAELARIQSRGEQEIEAAGKAARLDLRREAAKLALNLAEQKLRRRMTPQIEDTLTRSFVEDLRGQASQS